jgi:hypothetical protein
MTMMPPGRAVVADHRVCGLLGRYRFPDANLLGVCDRHIVAAVQDLAVRKRHPRHPHPTTTVTCVPPGLNTRCTCGFPGPWMVTVTVLVAPAASVPDIGETTTFFVRPGGSETDQPTEPPEAVSVIVPVAGGTTSSVVGVTLSVPGAAEMLTDADVETGLDGAAGTVAGPLADVPLSPGVTLAVTTVPSLTLGIGPAPSALPGTGPATPVAPVVPPAGGGTT